MTKPFNPKVSIVIPVYNGSNYLKEAIDSALAQTYENTEVIVINDGSNDKGKTDKICKSYGNKIRYFKKENGGVASALNMGIEKMEGKYFSWLSHDDVYYPNKIEKQIEYLSKNYDDKKILFCDYELINEKGEHIQFVKFDHKELKEKPEYALLRGCINGITLFIPKSAFDKYGEFDETLKCTQDYDMWRRFIKSYKFEHIPIIITKTRIHPQQDSNKNPNVITEGNKLWTSMMESVSKRRKEELENTEYNFYREMYLHLKQSPYEKARRYAENKAKKIYKSSKVSLDHIKVSMIIPFYNRIPLLLKSIDSVTSQTHKNLEIILVNDGSTEDISEVNKHIKKDKRIKLINLPENKGAAAARNIGMDNATGEYIAFLDSDDLFIKDKIKEQLKQMYLTGYNVSHTSYIRKYGKNEKKINSGELTGKVIPKIVKECHIATPTVMIKREYLKKQGVRFIEKFRIGEDTCFWLELLRNTKLLGIDYPYVIVNVGKGSSTSDYRKQLHGIGNILSFVLSDTEFSQYHKEVSNLCSAYIYNSNMILSIENGNDNILQYAEEWNRKNPIEVVKRLIYLFKYQGVGVTVKKIAQKYGGKIFK